MYFFFKRINIFFNGEWTLNDKAAGPFVTTRRFRFLSFFLNSRFLSCFLSFFLSFFFFFHSLLVPPLIGVVFLLQMNILLPPLCVCVCVCVCVGSSHVHQVADEEDESQWKKKKMMMVMMMMMKSRTGRKWKI